ncbi:hypothetical protein D030_2641A, partial [Vibrio parahaemolyticus AQ3810]|jgi:hypothetical protein
MIAN